MFIIKLVLKNALRHKLRTSLTILGIAIAVMSFGFLRTIVTAWSAGVEASAANRMIVRHNVSFIFPLPFTYRDQIQKMPEIDKITWGNWFGGVYKDPADWKNFFPREAVDADTWFEVYPEFMLSREQMADFKRDRNACVVGRKLADKLGFKLGDIIPIDGDIFPGRWEFVVRGIYTGKDKSTDETQMFFQWNYLNERMRAESPGRSGQVGWYVFTVKNAGDMPRVARTIDDSYLNSRAGTKTETEKEFQQSFVSMSSAIITSLEAISYIIISIIMLILVNTIVMAARERTKEYAVMKTLGFSGAHIFGLVGGESLLISCIGGAIGLALTFPIAGAFAALFPTFFPVFNVAPTTIALSVVIAVSAGMIAAAFPAVRAKNMKIVDGLRTLG